VRGYRVHSCSTITAAISYHVHGIAAPTSAVGLISLAGLLWSASVMMGSIRTGPKIGLALGYDVESALERVDE
jgi:hypothetical protein